MKTFGVLLAVLLAIAAVHSIPYYGNRLARGYSRYGLYNSHPFGIGSRYGDRYGHGYGDTYGMFDGPYDYDYPSYGSLRRRSYGYASSYSPYRYASQYSPYRYGRHYSPYRYGRHYSPFRFSRSYSTYHSGYPMYARSYRYGYRPHGYRSYGYDQTCRRVYF